MNSKNRTKKHIKWLKDFKNISETKKQDLLSYFNSVNYKLLTPDFANTKTAKNQGHGVLSVILHFAPHKLSGFNVCPAASKGCSAACLNTAGRGQFDSIQDSRIRKTLFFVKFRAEFMSKLIKEIKSLEIKAAKRFLKPVVRLNGTSDVMWESIKLGQSNIFQLFPNTQFYDYTKMIHRLPRLKLMQIPNYHITFSASESNWDSCLNAFKLGFNVAIVFNSIPETYESMPVFNGDNTDLRFLDPSNHIIGLKAKGKAKSDKSGFVKFIDINAALKAA